ncbi:hypothetical protein Sjap_015781 [Stephania japonica]|uniref:RING-type domain-containing protein n=1 Tax=Stephania japonica TaxID=461633 RepID=A0AAP0IJS4_9MAGN
MIMEVKLELRTDIVIDIEEMMIMERMARLDDSDDDDDDDECFSYVPASRSAIDNLEKSTLLDECYNCSICLEDMEIGIDEVMRLPCSHAFHPYCIIKWLGTNHVCPLCRFVLPD